MEIYICPTCGDRWHFGKKEFPLPEPVGKKICPGCAKDAESDKWQIRYLIDSGHPRHCAERIVWGDGECECHLYEHGYNPYDWMKKQR